MTVGQALASFAAVAGLLTITPGLDTALVLRTAATSGRRHAMAAAFGICLGCLAWGAAAALGLRVVLEAFRSAYDILRVVGAAYLVTVGARMIWRTRTGVVDETRARAIDEGPLASFGRGLFTNLLNPKVGAFYISFLPAFIPRAVNPGRFGLLLASIHALEGVLWFSVLIALTATLGSWLRRPRVRRTLNQATGLAFIGAGAKLLWERGQ